MPEVKTRLLCLGAALLLASVVTLAGEEAATVRTRFRAEVVKVGVLSDYTGPYVFAHRNPHFFLKVRLADEPAASLGWKQGEVVVLAARSVLALFGAQPTDGAVYVFSGGVSRKDGRLQFSDLQVDSGPRGR